MTAPAITDMTVDELRGAVRALRDVLTVTTHLTDAAAVRAMMEREATIAEAILANSVEEDEAAEQARECLADAAANHLAQAGFPSPGCARVAPSAPAPDSGQPAETADPSGPGTWTPARLELLREWPTAKPKRALLNRINALPGPPIASVDAMDQKARKLGMLRVRPDLPPEAAAEMDARIERLREAGRKKAEAARKAKELEAAIAHGAAPAAPTPDHIAEPSEMVPPPRVQAAPDAQPQEEGSPDDWTEDAQDEARTMLAAGRGARDLSHWFGGSLAWWQAWCERERAGERSAA